MRLVGERIGFDTNAKIVYHLLLSSSSNLSLFLSFSSLLLLLSFSGGLGARPTGGQTLWLRKRQVHFGTTAKKDPAELLAMMPILYTWKLVHLYILDSVVRLY